MERRRTIKKNFWFNSEEDSELKRKAELVGMNESDFIRSLVLNSEIKEKPDEQFYQAIRTIRSISHNINQLAVRAHSLGFIDELDYRKEVEKLDSFIDEIKRRYLNIRGDGK